MKFKKTLMSIALIAGVGALFLGAVGAQQIGVEAAEGDRTFYLDKGDAPGWWITDETKVHIWDGTEDISLEATKISDKIWKVDIPSVVFETPKAGFCWHVYSRNESGSPQNETVWIDGVSLAGYNGGRTNYFYVKTAYGSGSKQEINWETVDLISGRIIYASVDELAGWDLQTQALYAHVYQEITDYEGTKHVVNNVLTGGWPGLVMSYDETLGLYSAVVPVLSDNYLTNVIFNMGPLSSKAEQSVSEVVRDRGVAHIVGPYDAEAAEDDDAARRLIEWGHLKPNANFARFFLARAGAWESGWVRFNYWNEEIGGQGEVYPTGYVDNDNGVEGDGNVKITYAFYDVPINVIQEAGFKYNFKHYPNAADGGVTHGLVDMGSQELTYSAGDNSLIHYLYADEGTGDWLISKAGAPHANVHFLKYVFEAYYSCLAEANDLNDIIGWGRWDVVNSSFLYNDMTPKFVGDLATTTFIDYQSSSYTSARGDDGVTSLQDKHNMMWARYEAHNLGGLNNLSGGVFTDPTTLIPLLVITSLFALSLLVFVAYKRRKEAQ